MLRCVALRYAAVRCSAARRGAVQPSMLLVPATAASAAVHTTSQMCCQVGPHLVAQAEAGEAAKEWVPPPHVLNVQPAAV